MPAKRSEEFSPIRSQIECPLCHERFDFVDDALRHMRAELKLLQGGISGMRRVGGRRLVAEHGTDPGYGAHLKRGEPACPPCKAAHADKMRRYDSDPDVRMRKLAQQKIRRDASPELRARLNEQQKARYASDPGVRARHLEAARRYRARKKAEREATS